MEDPNDEPASELLKRIAADREARQPAVVATGELIPARRELVTRAHVVEVRRGPKHAPELQLHAARHFLENQVRP